MKKLDSEPDIGNAGDSLGMVTPRKHRCEPKRYRCHSGTYGSDGGPGIPPNHAAALARRPASAERIPPAHSHTSVSTQRHSATVARYG
jgi:hypothetical protein